MLIKTDKKTKTVKKIIKPKNNGDISISPNETKNKSGDKFITKNQPLINNTKIIDYKK